MRPNGIVTLLTDFGVEDEYVAVMKGVILGIAPRARFVDITHAISPQAIPEGAYVLQSAWRYFPAGTIHVAVVDPGVGTGRRAIAVAMPEAVFLGPDNGLLAPVLEDGRDQWGNSVEAVELDERSFWLPEISSTFHGRDIFAPVAAHLLNGVPLGELGRRASAIQPAAVPSPRRDAEGALLGEIVHVDHFGNCISNITRRHLHDAGLTTDLHVEIAGRRVHGLLPTYSAGPADTPIALIGSAGRLEVAVRDGSASQALGIAARDSLRVRSASG